METRILVLGFRRDFLKVLERRRIPYILWAEKKFKLGSLKPEKYIQAPFFESKAKIEDVLSENKVKRMSHVIATTESSVMSAYFARRHLKTRVNSKALVKRCTDKLEMKEFLRSEGIPMTPFRAAKKKLNIKKVAKVFQLPLVLKDRKNSGGRGTLISKNLKQLEKELSRQKLIEKYIEAPEASVECFVVGGIIRFANISHYYRKGEVNIVPAPYRKKECQEILELNQKVLAALGIDWGMTHLEVYRSKKGPVFGEVALRPPGGYIMELIAKSYGFNTWEAFLDVELGQECNFPQKAKEHSGVKIIHPGEGRVLKISGWQSCLKNKYVSSGILKVKKGDSISTRDGVGQEVGHIFYNAPKAKDIVAAVNRTRKQLRFTMKT